MASLIYNLLLVSRVGEFPFGVVIYISLSLVGLVLFLAAWIKAWNESGQSAAGF